METTERYRRATEWFSANIETAETELHYDSPFHLLIAVILSAQCTDKRVNMYTPEIFRRFPNPEDLASASFEEVYGLIRSISFPNNKAKHLIGMAKMLVEDKNVIVIPTKTVPQGITAIINFVPDMSMEENEQNMLEEIQNVRTGQVTYAVRDTEIDGKVITQDDIMGIGDQGILAVGKDIFDTTIEMVEEMIGDDEVELLSIYYGSDTSKEDAEKLGAKIEELYSECDVELQYGGQPIYYYVISAE